MKKRRRKVKTKAIKRLVVVLAIIIAAFILGASYLSTKNNNNGYSKLEKEVTDLVKVIDNNTLDIDSLSVKYKTKISKNEKVESALEDYLLDVAKVLDKVEKIETSDKYTNSLSTSNLKKDNYLEEVSTYLNETSEELDTYKKELEKLDYKDYLDSDNEDYEDYLDITKKLDKDKYVKKIDNLISDISLRVDIVSYLDKNSGNYEVNEKVTFLTKSSYEEFKELDKNNIVEYELVKDTKGPVINASDVTINVGDKYELKDKINCLDDIDGKVECKIDGEYNTNKVGSYKVTISSTDSENNTSTKEITITVKEKSKVVNTNKYYTEVIRNQNTVIVYGLDDNGKYTKIVKVFPCSVGLNNGTPTGTFKTSDKYTWLALYGGVYGQYATRFNGHILFHSVPYYSKDKSNLEYDEYNKLGTAASMGCVRMTVADVKWIYDNCPVGMTVKVYDGDLPKGVEKPTAPKIDTSSPNKGWDPTDPDSNNPWNK